MKLKTVGPTLTVVAPHWALMRFIICLKWFCRMEPATIRSVTEHTREVFSRPYTGSGCRAAWEFTQAIFNNHLIQPQKTGNCERGVRKQKNTRQRQALFLRGSTSHFTLISKNLRGENNSRSCLLSLYIILLVPSPVWHRSQIPADHWMSQRPEWWRPVRPFSIVLMFVSDKCWKK